MLRRVQKIFFQIYSKTLFLVLPGLWFLVLNTPLLLASNQATVFTYRAPESDSDARYAYDTDLLRLALESTIDTDGPYQLVPSPEMNYSRAKLYIETSKLPNFFVKLSYERDLEKRNMSFIPFPVDLGIVGFRVCFAHPEIIKQLSQVKTLEELKSFTHGQGDSWSDTEILRHNGFNVTTVAQYESLFMMVANRRFDLFCRGANELLEEFTTHRHIPNLSYDKSITISYPLPRFFFTNSANVEALDRVHRGIIKAYDNGSLRKLWRKHYKDSVDFAQLDRRKTFTIENPFVRGLDDDYAQYFFILPE